MEKNNLYASASREGVVRFWHPATLQLHSKLTTAHEKKGMLNLSGHAGYGHGGPSAGGRRDWLTGMAHMSACNKLAVSSLDTGVTFYDLATEQRKLVGRIPKTTLRQGAPMCLDYHHDPARARELLLVGDDSGAVNVFFIHDRVWPAARSKVCAAYTPELNTMHFTAFYE